jgi:hypothetical protein
MQTTLDKILEVLLINTSVMDLVFSLSIEKVHKHAIPKIAKIVRENSNVKKILIDNLDNYELKMLAIAMQTNTTIKELCFTGRGTKVTYVTYESFKLLIDALKGKEALASFDIRGVFYTEIDACITLLAELFESDKCGLKILDIRGGNLMFASDAAMKTLLDAINNYELTCGEKVKLLINEKTHQINSLYLSAKKSLVQSVNNINNAFSANLKSKNKLKVD